MMDETRDGFKSAAALNGLDGLTPAQRAEDDEGSGPVRIGRDNVEDVMTYHRPDEAQVGQHDAVNKGAIEFARILFDVCPGCPETTLAIRAIQEARFWANSAIAHRGRY